MNQVHYPPDRDKPEPPRYGWQDVVPGVASEPKPLPTAAYEAITQVMRRLSEAHHRIWELETRTSQSHAICNALTAEIEVLRALRDGE